MEIMNHIKLFLFIGLIIIGLFLIIVLHSRRINVKEKPSFFIAHDISEDPMDFHIINDSDCAVKIAKAAIQSVYHESPLLHGPYDVYHDETSGLYYISASGLIFHAEVHVVIDENDGKVVYIIHGKV
jgi:hypothetical protein